MIRVGRDELLGRRDHGREAALHVRCASTVEDPVADDRRERVATPLLERTGRHDIGVAGEAQHGAGIATARPEIGHAAELQGLDPEAARSQSLGHQGLTAGVGRCHGRAGDQRAGEFEGIRHGASL